MVSLGWSTYVAGSKPVVADHLPPGESGEAWSPTSSTLIYGERDAVLVDALLTRDEGAALADWVEATGKNLTTIYITHGHGDHFFGAQPILDRFPQARLVATPGVVEHMREQVGDRWLAFWRKGFPDQIVDNPVVAEPLPGHTVDLEGERLVAIELGHTDTEATTALHALSVDLVVAGDAVYNDVHLYLAETPHEKLQGWHAALDTIEALQPSVVIAGHKRDGAEDSPENIARTRRYLHEFDTVAQRADSAEELYHTMVERYPDRINRAVVWNSANAVKG